MKTKQDSTKQRVAILDGLRVVAIVMVMLYHYYYRFLGTHYDYKLQMPEVLKYGYLGVELFFIISGFVITLTLSKCASFNEFVWKRFVRLLPAMLICASFTFVFVHLFDPANLFAESKNIKNLLLSFTFISPDLVNEIFSKNLRYIDGAYWSLWVEITFYLIAGLLFFISSKHFLRNFSVLVFLGIAGHYAFISETGLSLLAPYIGHDIYLWFRKLVAIFTFFEYGIWFLIGIVLKKLYYNKTSGSLFYYFIALFFIQTLLIANIYTIVFTTIIFFVLLLFIYKPQFIAFLGGKCLVKSELLLIRST